MSPTDDSSIQFATHVGMTSILLNSTSMGPQSSSADAGASSEHCTSTGSATATVEVLAPSFNASAASKFPTFSKPSH